MSIDQYGYFGIFAVFMLLAAVWAICLIHIMQDAERHYNAGCLWGIAALVVPPIAIPLYYLMRLGAERGAPSAEQIERNKEERMLSRSPVAKFYVDPSGAVKHRPSPWEKIASEANRRPAGFKPYDPYAHLFEGKGTKQGAAEDTDQLF